MLDVSAGRRVSYLAVMRGFLLIVHCLLAAVSAYKSRLHFSFALRVTSDRPVAKEEQDDEALLPDSNVFKYGVDVAIAEENIILGNYEDAVKMADEAIRMAECTKIDSFKNVYKAYAQGILADAKVKEGQHEAAAELYRSALHRYESAYQAMTTRSPEAIELVGSTQLIAASLVDNETDYDAAVNTCQLALGLTKKLMPPDSREVAYALTNLAKAYLLAGDLSEGPEALLQKAIGLLSYHHANGQLFSTQDSIYNEEVSFETEERITTYLARAYSLLGDLHMARSDLDTAIDVWSNCVNSKTTFWEEEGVTEPEDIDTIDILCKLSVLLFSKDNLRDAETCARRALWSLELISSHSDKFSDSQKQEVRVQIVDLKSLLGSIQELKRQENEAGVSEASGF